MTINDAVPTGYTKIDGLTLLIKAMEQADKASGLLNTAEDYVNSQSISARVSVAEGRIRLMHEYVLMAHTLRGGNFAVN